MLLFFDIADNRITVSQWIKTSLDRNHAVISTRCIKRLVCIDLKDWEMIYEVRSTKTICRCVYSILKVRSRVSDLNCDELRLYLVLFYAHKIANKFYSRAIAIQRSLLILSLNVANCFYSQSLSQRLNDRRYLLN